MLQYENGPQGGNPEAHDGFLIASTQHNTPPAPPEPRPEEIAQGPGPWGALKVGHTVNKAGDKVPSSITTGDLAGLLAKDIGDRLWKNEMTGEIMLDGCPLPQTEFTLAYSRFASLGWAITEKKAQHAILQAAEARLRHPVREYLRGCQTPLPDAAWENIANQLLGEGHSVFDSSLIRKWLIFCVARAFEPGCAFGILLILAGKQQIHKTRFFGTLASEEFFLGGFQRSRSDVDDLIALHRSWIAELGEIDGGLTKHESAEMKAMVDRRDDTLRRPYAASAERLGRGFSLCGTTNKTDGFFVDETGNRRYAVIHVLQKINVEKLEQLRDQIWSSAVRDYRAGLTWHLTDEENATNNEANLELILEDAWEPRIRTILADRTAAGIWQLDSDKRAVFTSMDLVRQLEPDSRVVFDLTKIPQAHSQRVGRILRRLGYESGRRRIKPGQHVPKVSVWFEPG